MVRAQVANLGQAFENSSAAYTYLPKIAAANTTVTARALMTDFTADGFPRIGIDRIMTQQVMEVFGERGPNGERVFKSTNDIHDQIRFVGSWNTTIDANGQRPVTTTVGDYVEISFYGTGLNALVFNDGTRTFSGLLDGATSLGSFNTAGSGALAGRNYNQNLVVNVASNLTLGFHTVKLTQTGSSLQFFGFEVVNTSSSIFLPAATSYKGSRKYLTSLTGTMAYDSSFESGTLAARGGHVVIYQKVDGTIGKAVMPTNASSANLTSADHTNEEVLRVYHWREFGAGRTDDFGSLGTTSSNRSFTLDDGTTNLVGSNVQIRTDTQDALHNVANADFMTFTFVGTGLDIVRQDSAAGGTDTYTCSIDGSSIGTLSTTGSLARRMEKIVSGLPYGTHTFRITRTSAATFSLGVVQFIVYGPKTPTLPTDALPLVDYFVMATYVANSTAGLDTISTGVLRKNASREQVCVNGTGGSQDWTLNASPTAYSSGFELSTNRVNAYFEYVFFGTGFEQRFSISSNRSASIQVSLQSLSTGGSLQNLTTTNFPTIATSAYGTGAVFTASTGILDQLDAGSTAGGGFRVSALPLGLYKVRLLNNTASSFIVSESLDIITPVHAPREIGPIRTQNVAFIGSCSVRDLRGFSEIQLPSKNFLKPWSQAVGVGSSQTVTSTTLIPATDMSVTIKTTGGPIQVIGYVTVGNPANQNIFVELYIDGLQVPVSGSLVGAAAAVNGSDTVGGIFQVCAGTHKVDFFVRVDGGTGNTNGNRRLLTVREI